MSNAIGVTPVLRVYVADWLSARLVSGELKPGDRVDPAAVARELGISHIPVREALQGLAGEGRLSSIPRRGFFVPKMDYDSLESVYHWLSVIESEGYKLAMPLVTDQDVEKMAALCLELDEARARDDTVAYRKAHRKFHFLPLDRDETKLPVRFLQYLWDEAERYSLPHVRADVDIPRLQQQHLALVAAFGARDLDRVLTIMRDHRHIALLQSRRGDPAMKEASSGVADAQPS